MFSHFCTSQLAPVSVCRAVVIRPDGSSRVHYSYEWPAFWQPFRVYKLWRHLRFMRNEDKVNGHG